MQNPQQKPLRGMGTPLMLNLMAMPMPLTQPPPPTPIMVMITRIKMYVYVCECSLYATGQNLEHERYGKRDGVLKEILYVHRELGGRGDWKGSRIWRNT